MKFIIDENLSPNLVAIFSLENLEAYHVNALKANQKHRIIDDQLRRLTIDKGYVIVTKDDDFVKSYIDRKVPDRLVYIYGLNNKEALLVRMKEVFPQLPILLEKHDFIEINEKEIRFPLSN